MSNMVPTAGIDCGKCFLDVAVVSSALTQTQDS